MDKQDCFDFLTDLALDNKDFDWAKQIQKLKIQVDNNKATNEFNNSLDKFFDNGSLIVDTSEIHSIQVGQAHTFANILYCIKDCYFDLDDISSIIYRYLEENPRIKGYTDSILEEIRRTDTNE